VLNGLLTVTTWILDHGNVMTVWFCCDGVRVVEVVAKSKFTIRVGKSWRASVQCRIDQE
jgi:hypothetical protein